MTQTPTSEGFETVTDGTLIEDEFYFGVSSTNHLGSNGVSIIECDVDGNIIYEETNGGLGVTANVDIVRLDVQVVSVTTRAAADNTLSWNTPFYAGVVNSFSNIENTAAEAGAVGSSSTFT